MSKIYTDYMPKSVRNRKDFDVRAGDIVRVNVKIQEKGKTRLQAFEGLVLAKKHGRENGGTITVRKVSNGVGVERIFPLYSPNIESIEVLRRAKVRRSKLYFLRNVTSRKMRYKLRRISDSRHSSSDLPEWDTEEDLTQEENDDIQDVSEGEEKGGESTSEGEVKEENSQAEEGNSSNNEEEQGSVSKEEDQKKEE